MEKCPKYNMVEDKHIKTNTFCHLSTPQLQPTLIKKNIERTVTIAMWASNLKGFS